MKGETHCFCQCNRRGLQCWSHIGHGAHGVVELQVVGQFCVGGRRCCVAVLQRLLRPSVDSATLSQVGRARQRPTSPATQSHVACEICKGALTEWAHQVSQFQMLTERVPILLSSPEAEMLKTLPNHATGGKERSPRQSNNSSTMQRDRRCIFAHPQDSQVRVTLQVDAPCQPCKRRLLAFHRGYMPHSVPNHSPTPSARRPRLDGGFETEEPLHGPGVVSWFLGPLHVDRYTSHETFPRHFHPCAHITLWLKVSHDVSRASTFFSHFYLFCVLNFNLHDVDNAEH